MSLQRDVAKLSSPVHSLQATAYPGAPIYGGSDKVKALSKLVKDKDGFNVGNIHVRCVRPFDWLPEVIGRLPHIPCKPGASRPRATPKTQSATT